MLNSIYFYGWALSEDQEDRLDIEEDLISDSFVEEAEEYEPLDAWLGIIFSFK